MIAGLVEISLRGFGWPQAIILAVALQRIAELQYAKRNTTRLLAEGAVEYGARHYPLFFLLQGAWLGALLFLTPANVAIHWGLLAIFMVLQSARLWVIITLGRYWTTRIISLADAPLVTAGPYRWLRHPNYVVVAAEVVVLPLVFEQWWIAFAAGLTTALLLRHRISVEEAVLSDRAGRTPPD